MLEQKIKISDLESLLNPTTRKELRSVLEHFSKNDLIKYILEHAELEDKEWDDVYLHHDKKVVYFRYYYLGTNEWGISKESDRVFLEISLNENYEVID